MKDFKIDIIGQTWKIIFVDKKSPKLKGGEAGICYYDDCIIYIEKGYKKQSTKATLYHEITHAILAESSFNPNCEIAMGDFYENFVDVVSKCIATCMTIKKED